MRETYANMRYKSGTVLRSEENKIRQKKWVYIECLAKVVKVVASHIGMRTGLRMMYKQGYNVQKIRITIKVNIVFKRNIMPINKTNLVNTHVHRHTHHLPNITPTFA